MGNAWMVHVFVSRVGKVLIAKIRNAQTIAPAMVSAFFNRCIALANVSATLVGVVLVANASPCTHSSKNVQMTVQETVCAWMACVRATLAPKAQIAVTPFAQKG